MATVPSPGSPLLSQFADDPEMRELVELFLSELPTRISSLELAWRSREFARLRTLAHQLKGCGGGYGFPVIGVVAGSLEDTVRPFLSQTPGDVELERIQKQVGELVALCRRALPS